MRLRLAAVAILAVGTMAAGGLGHGSLPLAPDTALAGHGSPCGIVTKGNKDYKVFKRQMKCKRARRGTRRWLRTRNPLPGFTCQGNVPPYRFVCVSGDKTYRAIRL